MGAGGSDKTVLYVVGGVTGCMLLSCCGTIGVSFLVGVVAGVVDKGLEAPPHAQYRAFNPETGTQETIAPEDRCCCFYETRIGEARVHGGGIMSARECIDEMQGARGSAV